MKAKRSSENGSVLTVILVSVVLIGFTLTSYLHLVANQNQSILRSQQWNGAIAIAEAGIEEALAHLNKNRTNRLADGWAHAADGTNIVKERVLGDSKYRVFINLLKEPPVVLAEAYVKMPGKSDYIPVPRIVRTGTKTDPLFAKGLVAKGMIDVNGNNVRTDSFDSSDIMYNTGGMYDPTKNKDGGDVATNGQIVNVGNADIMGHVSTGPGGKVNIGPNGKVGDKNWHLSGNKGIQEGWVRDDMNVEFPDVELPAGLSSASPISKWDASGNPMITAGDFTEHGSLSLNNKKLIVAGHARLYIKNNLSMSGNAAIEILPGASLQIYVGGASAEIAGNGVVNHNSTASSFSYWGLNSNKLVSMKGNAAFTGTVYAPYAHFVLGGGGSTIYDYVGAAVVGSVKLDGHYNFHYDEALNKFGPLRRYIIDSWHETKGWQI